MNTLELFKNKTDSSKPISYAQFKSVGWSLELYIEYLKIVEEYRAYVIISESQESSKSKRNNDPFYRLRMFLRDNIGYDMREFKNFGIYFHYIHYGLSLGEFYNLIESHNPDDDQRETEAIISNIYLSSEDFRNKIENHVKYAFCPQATTHIKDAPTKDLREYLKQIESDYRSNGSCYIIDEIPSTEALYSWANEMEDVLRKELLEDDIWAIEDELERRDDPEYYDISENILYIHKSNNIKCYTQSHETISVTAILKGRRAVDVDLNITYCKNCNKYLISYSEFMYYRDLYGIMIGNFRMDNKDISYTGEVLRVSESPLMLSGYNVRDGVLTDSERLYILSEIIKNAIMSKIEIINYLQSFIQINGKKKGNERAVEKWENDLSFVRNFGMEEQEKVDISEIKKY